jgi:hypothetical protein
MHKGLEAGACPRDVSRNDRECDTKWPLSMASEARLSIWSPGRGTTNTNARHLGGHHTAREAGAAVHALELRKLAANIAGNCARTVRIGRERLRQVMHARHISFQRTQTWKESADPDRDAKLDRIEEVTARSPDRCFALTSSGRYRSGPPTAGSGRRAPGRGGCAPPTGALTGSATSTAATASAMISRGASPAPARAVTTRWPR